MGSIQNELNDFLQKTTGNHVSANEYVSGTNYLRQPRYHCILNTYLSYYALQNRNELHDSLHKQHQLLVLNNMNWVVSAVYLPREKRPGREADHSHPSPDIYIEQACSCLYTCYISLNNVKNIPAYVIKQRYRNA